jgi:CheY-like chemotaxis protein
MDEAGTGAEAVRRVRDGGAGAYDLIITDGKMPIMDGHEVRHAICRYARARALTRNAHRSMFR